MPCAGVGGGWGTSRTGFSRKERGLLSPPYLSRKELTQDICGGHQEPYRHKFARAKYKISNSREYDQSLKNRGSLIIWFSGEAVAKYVNSG